MSFHNNTDPGGRVEWATLDRGTLSPGLPPSVIARLQQWRATGAMCAGCHQRIHKSVTLVTRGAHCFHPSCATRHDATRSAPAVVAPSAPTIIATLTGSAGALFDRAGCAVFSADGTVEHERFAPGALDGVSLGSVRLKLNHSGGGLRGRFVSLGNDGGELGFRFELHDGAEEQHVLARIRSGQIRHCSVAFDPKRAARRYVGTVLEWMAVPLGEISVLADGHQPAWYGTAIRVA